MKFYLWCSGIIAIIFSSLVIADNCLEIYSVGKINQIVKEKAGSNIWVIRANCPANERLEAFHYQLLYEGDQIQILDESRVNVSFAQGKEQLFTQQTNNLPISGKTVKSIHDNQNNWYEKFKSAKAVWKLFGTPRKPIPQTTVVRGSTPRFLLAEDNLLPSGIQYLPVDYDQVAILWRGGPAIVSLAASIGTMETNTQQVAYLVTAIPNNQSEIEIRLLRHDIGWRIQFAKNPPLPSGLTEPDQNAIAERVIRAVWILTEGPLEWRIFALTELAKLAKQGYFSAEQLWLAALSGELTGAVAINTPAKP